MPEDIDVPYEKSQSEFRPKIDEGGTRAGAEAVREGPETHIPRTVLHKLKPGLGAL